MAHDTVSNTRGAGHPRLVIIGLADGEPNPEFALEGDVTTIGSAYDNDIVIEGLDQHHATVTRDAGGDYRLSSRGDTHYASARDGSPTNDAPDGICLRHGSGFTIRGTKFVFQREEFADQSPVGG